MIMSMQMRVILPWVPIIMSCHHFLEGTMSLSKLCHLRPGAARAYSTAVGKEVVIVGCARFHNHHSSVFKAFQSWSLALCANCRLQRDLSRLTHFDCTYLGPPWAVSGALWPLSLLHRWRKNITGLPWSLMAYIHYSSLYDTWLLFASLVLWPYLQLLTELVVQGRLWTKSTWVQCFRLVAGLGRSIRFVDLSWSVWSASPIHCTFLATSSKTELVRVGWARPQTGRQCLEQGFPSLCPAHLLTR